ncbi:3738_t:CDS:2, partial [Gigaspora margarita]
MSVSGLSPGLVSLVLVVSSSLEWFLGSVLAVYSLVTWIRPGTMGADDSESSLDMVGSNKSARFRVRFAIFGQMELEGQMVKNQVLV